MYWKSNENTSIKKANSTTLFLGGISTIILICVSVLESVVSLILFHGIIFSASILIIRDTDGRKVFSLVYTVCIVSIILMYVTYLLRHGNAYYLGGSDGETFEMKAKLIANQLGLFEYGSITGNIVGNTFNSVGYIYFLSFFVRVSEYFGEFHTLISRLVNATFLSYIAVMIRRISSKYVGLNPFYSTLSAIVVGLSPIMLWTAANPFRDIIVSFLILSVVYLALFRPISVFNVLVVSGLLMALYEFRYFAFFAAFAIYLYTIAFEKRTSVHDAYWKYLSLFLFVTLIIFSIDIEVTKELVYRIRGYYVNYTQLRGGARSDGLAQYIFKAPEPLSSTLRIAAYYITPVPVPTLQPEKFLLGLGTVTRLLVLPFVLYGIYYSLRAPQLSIFTFALLITYVPESILAFQVRHICMYYPFLAIMIGLGIEKARYTKVSRWLLLLLSYLVLTLGATLYVLLKVV